MYNVGCRPMCDCVYTNVGLSSLCMYEYMYVCIGAGNNLKNLKFNLSF